MFFFYILGNKKIVYIRIVFYLYKFIYVPTGLFENKNYFLFICQYIRIVKNNKIYKIEKLVLLFIIVYTSPSRSLDSIQNLAGTHQYDVKYFDISFTNWKKVFLCFGHF